MSRRKAGWGLVGGSRKWHYFAEDGRSLCRKWMKLTDAGLEQGSDDSPDNCAACRRAKPADEPRP